MNEIVPSVPPVPPVRPLEGQRHSAAPPTTLRAPTLRIALDRIVVELPAASAARPPALRAAVASAVSRALAEHADGDGLPPSLRDFAVRAVAQRVAREVAGLDLDRQTRPAAPARDSAPASDPLS